MKAEHFKELLETVCRSTNSRKIQIAKGLDIPYHNFKNWQYAGVPHNKRRYVYESLKEYLFERIGG